MHVAFGRKGSEAIAVGLHAYLSQFRLSAGCFSSFISVCKRTKRGGWRMPTKDAHVYAHECTDADMMLH